MQSKKDLLGRILESSWSVGLVTFIGGLISAAILQTSQSAPARTVSISLIAALVLTNVARLINSARDGVKEEMKRTRETAAQALRTHEMGRLVAEIQKPFLRYIAKRLLDNTHAALRQLAGQNGNVLRNQGEYMNLATPRIQALGEGGSILALCGDKDWDDEAVKDFNEANCAAAMRGARVERVFLQLHSGSFSPGEQSVIDMHFAARQAGAQITAYLVPPNPARELANDYCMPQGFGFTYISSTRDQRFVLVHWGLEGSDRDGLRLESPVLIPIFEEIFNEARRRAYVYQGPGKGAPQGV
jgi:hypothetical protein